MTQISNDWITLTEEKNGVPVQRKFAGLRTHVDENNNVIFCFVDYWQRELYPNNEVIKTELKSYSLQDLPESVNDVENWSMAARAVLSGFIQQLGQPAIVNPARETLENCGILPINAPDGYPLHLETREKTSL